MRDLESKRLYNREYYRRPEARERRYARQRAARKATYDWRNFAEDPRDTPDDIWVERRRANAAGPRDLTAALFGDPLPGRSALDRESIA